MPPSVPDIYRAIEKLFRAAGRNLIVTFPSWRVPQREEVFCWYTGEEKLAYSGNDFPPARVSSQLSASLVARKEDAELVKNLLEVLATDLQGSTVSWSSAVEEDRVVFLVSVISPRTQSAPLDKSLTQEREQ